VAAINASFFNVKTGEPIGLLKVAGELVSDTTLSRASSQSRRRRAATLAFDQISARLALSASRTAAVNGASRSTASTRRAARQADDIRPRITVTPTPRTAPSGC
jgi:exopolysaccharide biosynthesis protein